MKVLYFWLKEIIPFRLTPEALAEKLTMIGLEVEAINKDASGDASGDAGDTILDIAVTSNRPDCLGIIGIAREVHAILSSWAPGTKRSRGLRLPHAKLKESRERTANNVRVSIQDKALCHRYTARLIKNVKVKQSPPWLKNRLKALGLRPINNIVDITNYVLMEYGHPLHAFDFDRIKGRKIIVRRAKAGEKIITLDGVPRELDKGILVIADNEKPQAIAGVIGGMESEVSEGTTNILLESAYFDPGAIRRASKKLGISTDSSYRFERGADKEAVSVASQRAMALIQELAGGDVLKGEVDVYPRPSKPVRISLRLKRVRKILGVEIEKSRIRSILNALGLKVEKSDGEVWRIRIPGFRRDLSLEIDLIEEIARHFGYTRIPATLPSITIAPPQQEYSSLVYENVKEIMTSAGFDEVINFSFYSKKKNAGPAHGREPGLPVSIKNPISEEQGVMRLSLAHGLLGTANLNLSRGEKAIKIFELGKTYFLKNENTPHEKYCLGALCLETAAMQHWKREMKKIDFYDIKGVIELLFNRLGIEDVDFRAGPVSYFNESSSTLIYAGNKDIGWVGEVDKNTLTAYDINQRAFLFEIYVSEIIPSVRKAINFRELPKFPASFRDISIIVPEEIVSREITRSIEKSGDINLEKIELIDLYRGKQIPPGRVGLTYRLTFRSLQRTLREEEVNNLFSRIISDLKTTFPIELREK